MGRAQTPSRRGSRVLKAHTPRAQQGSPGMPEEGTPRVSPLRLASLRHALSGAQHEQLLAEAGVRAWEVTAQYRCCVRR